MTIGDKKMSWVVLTSRVPHFVIFLTHIFTQIWRLSLPLLSYNQRKVIRRSQLRAFLPCSACPAT